MHSENLHILTSCQECGRMTNNPERKGGLPMVCQNCKNTIPDGCTFCGHCGERLDDSTQGRKAPRFKKKLDPDASYDIQNPYLPKKQTDPRLHFSNDLCTFQEQYDTSNTYMTDDRYAYQHTPGTRRYSTRLNRFSRKSNAPFSINDLSIKQLIAIFAGFIAFIVILVVIFTALCSKPLSPVGKWRSYLTGTTITYDLRKDGSYTCNFEGLVDADFRGHYTYDDDMGTITFKAIVIGATYPNVSTCSIDLRDSCIVLDNITYGRVCDDDETCDAMKDVLGTWHDTSDKGVTITFSKDGTYHLETPTKISSGLFIYDPVLKTIELPQMDASFSYLPKSNGGKKICWDDKGLYFTR